MLLNAGINHWEKQPKEMTKVVATESAQEQAKDEKWVQKLQFISSLTKDDVNHVVSYMNNVSSSIKDLEQYNYFLTKYGVEQNRMSVSTKGWHDKNNYNATISSLQNLQTDKEVVSTTYELLKSGASKAISPTAPDVFIGWYMKSKQKAEVVPSNMQAVRDKLNGDISSYMTEAQKYAQQKLQQYKESQMIVINPVETTKKPKMN